MGAPYIGVDRSESGHVRIFRLRGSRWVKVGKKINGASTGDVESGHSVALSANGDIVAIGSPSNDDIDRGHVRVFKRNSSVALGWEQLGESIVGETLHDRAGWSIALSDDGFILAIGSPYNDANDVNSGHVRVFKYIETSASWSQIGDDIQGEIYAGYRYAGYAVALSGSGTVVAISAIGTVRVFELDDVSRWVKIGDSISKWDSSIYPGSKDLVSLSASGDIVAFVEGAWGRIRVFHRDETDTW